MDLPLVIALNMMAVSAVALMLALRYRHAGSIGWAVVHGLVLAVGGLALALAPAWVAYVVAAVFVPLVVLPLLLFQFAGVAQLNGHRVLAARLATAAHWLHPSSAARFQQRFAEATQNASGDALVLALERLRADATTSQRIEIDLAIAHERGDWPRVLDAARQAGSMSAEHAVMELRALGELGRRDEMCMRYEAVKTRLNGEPLVTAQLFLFAFAGQRHSVETLLRTSLANLPMEARLYWRAIAARANDPGDGQATATLETLASRAFSARTRVTAAVVLEAAPPPPLDAAARAIVDAAADRLARLTAQPQLPLWRTYVTLALLLANSAMSVVAHIMGGTENLEVLYRLGAMWPPVMQTRGEWWRLGAASFLHLGPIHLLVNMFMLAVLGRGIESRIGSVKMALLYTWCALGSMTVVYLLMRFSVIETNLLIGASGAIFGLFGAIAALDLVTWWRTRDRLDLSRLGTIAFALGLQTVVDFTIPNVSFAAHASGFVVGLVAGAVVAVWECENTH